MIGIPSWASAPSCYQMSQLLAGRGNISQRSSASFSSKWRDLSPVKPPRKRSWIDNPVTKLAAPNIYTSATLIRGFICEKYLI